MSKENAPAKIEQSETLGETLSSEQSENLPSEQSEKTSEQSDNPSEQSENPLSPEEFASMSYTKVSGDTVET